MNLGRSVRSPGAYNIWVPSAGRIVVASDVYFNEQSFPWLPPGPSDTSYGQPSHDDGSQPPGLAQPSSSTADAALPATRRMRQRDRPSKSSRVLVLFSGPLSRPDGIATFLQRYGLAADCVDSCPAQGGGSAHDILVNSVYERLLQRCADGYYMAVFASPPCFAFSVSRFFSSASSTDGGPPPVRNRDHPLGVPNVPAQHARELSQSNEIVRRTVSLLRAAHIAGAKFILEHSADRGALSSPIFLHRDHAPIWLLPDIVALKADTGSTVITFPQCALGASSQKYTSLLLCTP
eukprot:2838326-Pleurochrysis_carterae.AAC.1